MNYEVLSFFKMSFGHHVLLVTVDITGSRLSDNYLRGRIKRGSNQTPFTAALAEISILI